MLTDIQCFSIVINFRSKNERFKKFGLFLIDLDEIFPMQSLEFTKSVKTTSVEKMHIFFSHLKWIFIAKNIYFKI